LLAAGCLDINLAIDAAERALRAFKSGDVLFPEKIVQIFNDDTQERIPPGNVYTGEDLWRQMGLRFPTKSSKAWRAESVRRYHSVRD